MFKKGTEQKEAGNKTKAKVSNMKNNPNAVNRISSETVVEGSIKTEGDIRIDGVLKGSLVSKGKLFIGPSGKVEGDVVCQNGDVSGEVHGKVTVLELLVLKDSAVIDGDIITNKFVVEAGAKFNGNCRMGAIIKEMENEKIYELAAQE